MGLEMELFLSFTSFLILMVKCTFCLRNITLCCPEGLGLDSFALCTTTTEHRKDLFEKKTGWNDIKWITLDSTQYKPYFYGDTPTIADLQQNSEVPQNICLDFLTEVQEDFRFVSFAEDISHFLREENATIHLYACCPKGTMLNTETDKCEIIGSNNSLRVYLQRPRTLALEYFGLDLSNRTLQVQKPKCDKSEIKYWASQDSCSVEDGCLTPEFHVDHFGRLIPRLPGFVQEKLPQDHFCLATNVAGNTVARVCYDDKCKNGGCLTKCCQANEILQFHESVLNCPSVTDYGHRELNFEKISTLAKRIRTATKGLGKRYGFPNCPHGWSQEMLDSANMIFKQDFWILENGSLFREDFEYGGVYENYCYEEAIDTDNQTRLVAFVCQQMRQNDELHSHHFAQGIAMIIAAVFHGMIILAHFLLPNLWTLQGFTIVSQSLSLMVNFILMFRMKAEGFTEPGECIAEGEVAYFTFEASLAWLAVMSLDVYLALSGSYSGQLRRQSTMKLIALYCAIGWGLPAILVMISVLIDNSDLPASVLRPYFRTESCWLYNHPKILGAYLYGPAGILIGIDMVLFAILAKKLYAFRSHAVQVSREDRKNGKGRVCAIFKLSVLMGVTWFFEILSFAIGGSVYIWYFTDFLNILLPVFIFFLFICKRKNLDSLGLRYPIVGQLMKRHFSWEPAFSSSSRSDKKCDAVQYHTDRTVSSKVMSEE